MRKWINRFAPMFKPGIHIKIADLYLGTVVDATGVVSSDHYEEVVYDGPKGPVTGWIHTDDLEDYVRNYPDDCVVIENQTPDTHDFKQYMLHKGVKQVNMCGELSACYILNIGLGTMLDYWDKKVPAFYKRIFGAGKARGTGAEELGEMMSMFGRQCTPLTTALFQPHIKRARYTIKALNELLAHGGVIVSVHMNAVTGLLNGGGVLHWVTLIDIKPERNGQGVVSYYNPAMNCVETCSWNEFVLSAGQVYGMFRKNLEWIKIKETPTLASLFYIVWIGVESVLFVSSIPHNGNLSHLSWMSPKHARGHTLCCREFYKQKRILRVIIAKGKRF